MSLFVPTRMWGNIKVDLFSATLDSIETTLDLYVDIYKIRLIIETSPQNV